MRTKIFSSFVILSMVISLVVGCSSTHPPKKKVEKKAPKAAKKDAPKVAKKDAPKAAKKDAPKPNQVLAKEQPNDDAAKQFQQDVAQEQIRKDESRYLVQSLLSTAKKRASKGNYRDAYVFVQEALAIESGNPQALKLKHEYGQQLGLSPDEIRDQLSESENVATVRIEQARIEIENRIAQGKRHFRNREYDKAVPLFKQAKELLRWMPYQTMDFSGKARQIDFLIRQAEKQQSKKQEALRRKRIALAEKQAKEQELERIRTQQQKIQNLFRQANIAFESERYDLAESFCDQIGALDPDNTQVKELKNVIKEARHAKFADVTRESHLDEWKNAFEQVEDASVLFGRKIVQFPSYERWKHISNRGAKGQKEEEEKETPETRAIKERLKTQELSMDFTEAPLSEVVDFLRSTTGINIIIDPAVFTEFPEEEALKVDLTVNKLKLEAILELILSLKSLAYKVENGVVIISTQKRTTEKPLLRLYDVRDLTGKLPDFPGAEINLVASTGQDDRAGIQIGDADDENAGAITEEQLTDLIKGNIAKNSWENETNSIDTRQGTLIIRQTKTVHEQIKALLNDLRKSTGLLVTIETRFITVEDKFLEDVGIDYRSLGATALGAANGEGEEPASDIGEIGVKDQVRGGADGTVFRRIDDFVFNDPAVNVNSPGTGEAAGLFFSDVDGGVETKQRIENLFDQTLGVANDFTNTGGLSTQLAFLDDVELQAILRAVRKRSRSNVTFAPKLTVFNTQRANISILTQQSFLQDFDVEIATNATILDPIVGTVQTGVILDVRPIISADRKYITLELRPVLAALRNNITDGIQTQINGVNVTIETPDIQMIKLKTTVTVPDGGTLLLGGLMKNTRQDFDNGIPFLSDLPLISFLTSRRGQTSQKESLIMLCKATITSLEEHEPNVGLNR